MPDDDDFQDEDESSVIRELRSKAKRAAELEPEVLTLRQENALLKAGLDLSPAQQKALLAAHEGDMDRESLRKTATEVLNIRLDDEPEPEPQVPADEVAAHQRIADATAAAIPAEAHVDTLEDRINAAQSMEELDSIMAEAGMLGISE